MRDHRDLARFIAGVDLAQLRENLIDLEVAVSEAPFDDDLEAARTQELYDLLHATRAALQRAELRNVAVRR